MEDVLVRYTTSFSNDAREERLKAMVVNSKVLLIVRGAMNVNSASIKASEYNNERKGQQNKVPNVFILLYKNTSTLLT